MQTLFRIVGALVRVPQCVVQWRRRVSFLGRVYSLNKPHTSHWRSTPAHKLTQGHDGAMSALPPKADIDRRDRHVRFVPKAESCSAAKTQAWPALFAPLNFGSGNPL